MILVAGGTGRLGSALVPLLTHDGERVRTMSRGASVPFPTQTDDGVERCRGDLASRADCERAVSGCRQVVFAASGFGLRRGGNPRTVDRDGALRLVDAAVRAGAEHLVMMSMYGAALDAPLEFLRCKATAEEAIRSSGKAWTVIRLGANLEQFLAVMGRPLESKGRVLVFGTGTAHITFTSTADAAAAVAHALADPALRKTTLEWGSEVHTLNELAAALLGPGGGDRTDKAAVRRIPVAALRVMAVAARPFSPFLARMAGASLWMEAGGAYFDPSPQRAAYPDLPVTGLAKVALRPEPYRPPAV